MRPARPWPALLVACALGLGTALSLGFARFAYALLLPPMRADLAWSYFTAGAMNTVNAAGYLAGALVAPICLRRVDARTLFLAASAAIALALLGHGVVVGDAALYAVRFAAGVASAVSLVTGGVLAARLAVAPAEGGRASRASLVLGLYYGGTGLGIVVSTGVVQALVARPVAHAWQGAWIALAVLGAAATAAVAAATRGMRGASPSIAAAAGRFAWLPFAPALFSYGMFGVGYIGYMTFIITLLRDEHFAGGVTAAFFALLGAAVMASPWLWAGLLQRYRGGGALAWLSGLLALATLLPVLSERPLLVFCSGLLFGAVFLSLVTSTTSLIRHNLAPAGWPAAIAAFTVVFAVGQIFGPALVGWIADHFGGLRIGFACSAGVLALGALAATRQRRLAAEDAASGAAR